MNTDRNKVIYGLDVIHSLAQTIIARISSQALQAGTVGSRSAELNTSTAREIIAVVGQMKASLDSVLTSVQDEAPSATLEAKEDMSVVMHTKSGRDSIEIVLRHPVLVRQLRLIMNAAMNARWEDTPPHWREFVHAISAVSTRGLPGPSPHRDGSIPVFLLDSVSGNVPTSDRFDISVLTDITSKELSTEQLSTLALNAEKKWILMRCTELGIEEIDLFRIKRMNVVPLEDEVFQLSGPVDQDASTIVLETALFQRRDVMTLRKFRENAIPWPQVSTQRDTDQEDGSLASFGERQ